MENKEIKNFEEPKMEIILFGEDIITTSGGEEGAISLPDDQFDDI